MPVEHLIVGGLAILLGVLSYVLGYRHSAARYDLIREVPTLQAKDVPGLGAATVEVKGITKVESPLISDLARVACVAFHSRVTEHWTTTHVVSDGKGRTRVTTQSHTETRHEEARTIPFEVHDDSGCVTVRPDGAEMELIDGMEMSGLSEPGLGSIAADIQPRHFGGRLTYSDQVLPVELQVYVLGHVTEDHAIAAAAVGNRPFLISYRTEDQLLKRARWGKWGYGVLTLLLLATAVVAFSIGASMGHP